MLVQGGRRAGLWPNLDLDKVSYVRVVSHRGGRRGIQAEYVLRNVTFSQAYDVAEYVVTHRAPVDARRSR